MCNIQFYSHVNSPFHWNVIKSVGNILFLGENKNPSKEFGKINLNSYLKAPNVPIPFGALDVTTDL